MTTVLIILAVVVVGILIMAAMKPDAFRIARTTTINAPAEKIFPFIEDFHQWTQWSPYEKLDSSLKKRYSGAEKGVGAVYDWEGNNKVGKGRMEMTEVSEPSKVVINLHFEKPFTANNTAEFTLMKNGEATDVTWAMTGSYSFASKVMCIFVNMDKMVGKDFEKGLATLKQVVEK